MRRPFDSVASLPRSGHSPWRWLAEGEVGGESNGGGGSAQKQFDKLKQVNEKLEVLPRFLIQDIVAGDSNTSVDGAFSRRGAGRWAIEVGCSCPRLNRRLATSSHCRTMQLASTCPI